MKGSKVSARVAPLAATSPHYAALHCGLSASIGFKLKRQYNKYCLNNNRNWFINCIN